jgi:ribosomal protein L11 methylase PrmA
VRRSVRTAALPRAAYHGLLAQLRGWIARLEPRGHTRTTWSDYETSHTYANAEHQAKHEAVKAFIAAKRPAMVWDFGCNTGEYSQLALDSGAARVVGFEADHGALERAFARAAGGTLAFLPLYMDAANPSPDQGWAQRERAGLLSRGPAEALLALAFIHHLAIGRNVPLDHIAAWLTSCARSGIVEFVQKSDPTVQLMLSTREDIFDTYTEEAFAAALARHARIVERRVISAAGRTLFQFETSG